MEFLLAWVLFFVALLKKDAIWFIASGVYAIATNIAFIVYQMKNNK